MPNPRRLEQPDGHRWEVTYRIQGRMVRRRFKTKVEASAELANGRAAAAEGRGIIPADGRITVASYAARWLDGLQVRDTTLTRYEVSIRRAILPALGDRTMSSLQRQDTVQFLKELQTDSGYAPATVQAVYRTFASIMRSAVHDRVIAHSPCVRVRPPQPPPKLLAMLTPDQANRLLDEARRQHFAMMAVGLACGLRQGELLGLRLPNVRLLQRELTVDEQVRTERGGTVLTRELKTPASRRVVPMPPFVVNAVALHIERYGVGPDGLLFRNPRNGMWRRGSWNDSVWKPNLERAGIPRGFGSHAMRHTYASSLIAAGLHPRVIQARLGHKSIVETMDTYGHLFPEAHEETSQALEQVYGTRGSKATARASESDCSSGADVGSLPSITQTTRVV